MLAKGFGGGERLFVDLSAGLTALGHDVMAICQKNSETHVLLQQCPGIKVLPIRAFGNWDIYATQKNRNGY